MLDRGSVGPACKNTSESLSACKCQPELACYHHKDNTNRCLAVLSIKGWLSTAQKQLLKHANCIYKSPFQTQRNFCLSPALFPPVTSTMGHFKPSPITSFFFLNEFFLSFAHIESIFFLERHIHTDILLKSLENTFWFSQHTNMSLIKANHRSSLFLCQSITEEGKWNLCESRPLGRLMGSITESGPLRGSRGS